MSTDNLTDGSNSVKAPVAFVIPINSWGKKLNQGPASKVYLGGDQYFRGSNDLKVPQFISKKTGVPRSGSCNSMR